MYVPVLRFLLPALLLAFAAPVLAAEPLGQGNNQALPPGITPEQAAAARELVGSDPEARKALEDALKKQAGEAETEEAKRDIAAKKPDAEAAAKAARAATEVRYDWTKSPYVGGLFGKRLTAQEKEVVVHFGHDLAASPAGAESALETMPVAPGYIVGPGDEIVVRMWGRMEGSRRVVVDRDGKIFFPKLGTIYVAGKTFEEVKALIKAKISTVAEVSTDVSMGQMKGIRVSVMGEVRSPGWYNVSSFHTALQVLAAAGRIKDIGSLRRIRIQRGGGTAVEVDLYDFLLKGDTRADIRLLQGDVIFVPVVGRLAAVAGEVRRPAIYELKGEKSLLELIRLAGGFTPAAYKRRVQVERLEGHTARIVLDTDADELEKSRKGFELADGDVVRVFPIVLADENSVKVDGNVRRPGKYELKKGMTVGSLFADEKEFLPETYFDYALITRLVPPDLHKEVVPVNLREIVLERKPGSDVALLPRDTLKVFRRRDFKDLPKASISGEVRLTRKELLKTLGLDNQALAERMAAEEARLEPGGADAGREEELRKAGLPGAGPGKAGVRATDADRADSRDRELRGREIRGEEARTGDGRGAETLDAESRDGTNREKKIREAETRGVDPRAADSRAAVSLDAKPPREDSPFVREALTFEIHGGARVADLVKMAGGVTRLALLERAEIVRVDDNRTYRTIYFHLGKALAGDPEENKLLENEDQVRIHSIREKAFRKTVAVSGEVNQPGDFVLTEGMKLSDLLFKAGGVKESAYMREAELIRREVSPQGDLVKTQTIVVYPDRALSGDAAADVPLAADDFLYVRQIPDWGEKIHVVLAGEFRFPGTYAVRKGERLSSVIERAGGYTEGAYTNAGMFTRISTRKTQQEAIDRMIEQLEISVAEKGQEIQAALDREDIETNRQLVEARRAIISQLRKLKAQ
ncbi:MAG: periplasmic protein involved in polysaccharide export, partial [Deltaproteobacteria bacterium]|nr:periplasmic protein involved in polysaccharide export [Deltaproteobacteria bacterium]